MALRSLDPRSFRDPDGSLVLDEGRVFRVVAPEALHRLETVLSSRVVRGFMDTGEIIRTSLANPSTLPHHLQRSVYGVYEHPKIPFVSYAHEWSPAMLAEAALHTLRLAKELLAEGFVLKDATPSNVLFQGSRPVFIDILSIVPRERGTYLWLAANQFESTFLLPLTANAHAGAPISWLCQDTFSGISHEFVGRLLGARRFKPSLLTSVALPAALSSSSGGGSTSVPTNANDDAAKFILLRTLQRYERLVTKLMHLHTASFWKSYTDSREHYSSTDLNEKLAFVSSVIEDLKPEWTLDIGANTGEFSALAARKSHVVALEMDESSAQGIFRRAREQQLDIQPIVSNFARPAPGLGWENREISSLLSRIEGRFDLVMMLAVIHHLRVGAGIPIAAILDAVCRITRRYLLVEHVPPEDVMFRQIAKGRETLYGDCERAAFEAALTERFRILKAERLKNGRTLYLGERLIP